MITEFEWNHHFADIQKKGPFKSFHHRHEVIEETRGQVKGTVVRDVIEYEVGFGWLGKLAQSFLSVAQLAANIRISSAGAREAAEIATDCVGRVGSVPTWPVAKVVMLYLLGSTTTAVP